MVYPFNIKVKIHIKCKFPKVVFINKWKEINFKDRFEKKSVLSYYKLDTNLGVYLLFDCHIVLNKNSKKKVKNSIQI